MLTLKVVPVYMENHAIGSVLDSLDHKSTIDRSTPFEVKDWILKGFKMNGIRDISPNAVRVRRKGAFLTAKINYERRIGFVGNIDIVLSFENSWKIKQQ
nr:DUF4845 domain-containing protein [Sansalvadorimonas sp. 2012CJ34-2]